MQKNDRLWKLSYNHFEPEDESLREALCTLSNGYLGTRGAACEAVPSEIHYPGMYIAGVYNRLPTKIAGRTVVNEDLVNCPNWIYISFQIEDGEWFCPSATKLLAYRQELNMKDGTFFRKMSFKSHKRHKTKVTEHRIVHMADPHLCAIHYEIMPENYSGCITVRSMLDGAMLNMNVERYRELNFNHWRPHSLGSFDRNGIYLSLKTSQSKIEVCEAAKLRIFINNKERKPKIEILKHAKEAIGQEVRVFVEKGSSCVIEKIVCVYTSQDKGVSHPKISAIEKVKQVPRFKQLLKSHKQAWAGLWQKFDIKIDGHAFSQKVLRSYIFHLLQTASIHNINIDAGFPARGLHGEAYRGHIFWDEVFSLHFFNLHQPEVAKALLLYRFRRLPAARVYAKANGYQGAMFPWQSGSSGREETQIIHLNPKSGKWGPDYSRLQRHVSFSIAYNIWQYWQATADFEFLLNYGAEVILSIAQFAASLVYYSSKDKRYHTRKIMGPDEFHEKMPRANRPGLRDNAYSNVMIASTLRQAVEIFNILPEDDKKRLMKKIKLTTNQLHQWDNIRRKMNLVINNEGIISQFDGYFKLKELNWTKYRTEYGNIYRMDRILKAEGKLPDAYKVSKQADVLMFFYLLPLAEVKDILKQLGYYFDRRLLNKNYDYYLKRTSHGSTLSKVVHSFIAQLLGRDQEAWCWFLESLESDIYDTQGGTTPEGIHSGVMGGALDIVLRGFAGVTVNQGRLKIEPRLPASWQRIKFKLFFQERWIDFDISKKSIKLKFLRQKKKIQPVLIELKSKCYTFYPGRTLALTI